MNIIILGGFLGSGKTSFLKLLADSILKKENGTNKVKLAIIENEIGKVGLDQKYLKSHGYVVRELFKGCICCTLSTDLISCLNDIEKNENPSWVVIEATGLARPDEIAKLVKEYFAHCNIVISCVLIDAKRWFPLSSVSGTLIQDQVKYADYLLINKIDLIDTNDLEHIIKDLEINNTSADIFKISTTKNSLECSEICELILNK